MTPTELAEKLLVFITPLLIKGGEALTEGMGKDIWQGIKGLFKKENKEPVLENLQKNPNDEESKEEVKAHLTSMLYTDALAKEQLEKQMITIQNNQHNVNINQTGDINVASGGSMKGSSINIHKL